MFMSERSFYIDNLKGILIIFVIIGHLIPKSISFPLDGIYAFIYMFHMPFFILISGYLSKHYEKQTKKAFSFLVLYYILSFLFNIYYTNEVYISLSNIKNIKFNLDLFLQPFIAHSYSDWYLAVLFALRILCPAIIHLKHYVIFSFIICFITSLLDIDNYTMRRTLMLLPFFIVGFYLNKYKYEDIRKNLIKWQKAFGLIGLICIGFCLFIVLLKKMTEDIKMSIFTFGGTVLDNDIFSNLETIIYSTCYLIISFALIYAISCLVKNKECFLTQIGKNSLCVYFIQGFITLAIRQHIIKDLLRSDFDFMFIFVFVFIVIMAVLIAYIFSRSFFTSEIMTPIQKFSLKFIKD